MKNLRCVFVFLAVMGLAGLALGAGCGSDVTATAVPDPISVNTLDGSEGVPVDSTFKYVFSRPMITSAVTKSTFFMVKNEVSSSLNKAVVDGGICDSTQAIDTTGECSSPTECTLTPAELLEYSSVYSICLTGNMQYDTGEQFGSFMATFTAEAEGPLDLNNLDGAVDVPVDSSFRYRFLKEVDTSTVDTSTYFIVPTVDPASCDSANAVASEITCTRWSCTIAPSAYLEYITGYTACLASGISYTSSFTFNGFMASFTTGDLSSPTNLGLSVVNRRAAQIELSWDSSSDIPSEWENVRHAEVRCVEDEPITLANWDTAMQFADDPISGASPINWTMLVAEDVSGNKIRAGHDYYCGIRGESIIDNQWSSLMTFSVIAQSDIGFLQYATVIEGYTRYSSYWMYYSSVEAAGDVNGDNYDDLLVGFGVGSNSSTPGHAAAVYFGSADGPSESNKLDISCTDDTFGGAMVGIGDFDNDGYPDIASGAGGSDRVYIFRGHAGLGSSALDCADADITIVGPTMGGPPGNYFGNTIAAVGDFDGDGYKDIAIGAPMYNSYNGAVWIVFGRSEASYPVTIDLNSGANADGALFISGLVSYSSTGFAAGDLDKDGYWDLVFTNIMGGAYTYGQVQVLNGYAVVKPPDTVTTLTPADLDQVVDFAGPSNWFSSLGQRGVSILDFDSDGCMDVAVGALGGTVGSGATRAGNVLVYRGQTSGVTCTGLLGTTPYAVTYGSTVDDWLGRTLAGGMNMSLTDPEPWRVNGLLTSVSDVTLLAGARQGSAGPGGAGAGYVALWYGGFTENLSSAQADVTFPGISEAVGFCWVNYVGDLDGDGYVDIGIGDPEYGTDGRIVIYH